MHSIRTKLTLLTMCAIIVALSVAACIGVISIKKLGESDADQMIHTMCNTGAVNLEAYFYSVEHSVQTVSTLVQDSLKDIPLDQLGDQVERARNLFAIVALNTNGALTYYFRIDPEVSDTVKGFWYVDIDGEGFVEYEVTDITMYDTNDTSALVWFTVPKATGKGLWLPPYYTENLDIRVISYNVPVYRNDRFIGVIGIEIEYDTLAKEAQSIKLFDNGYAFIVDADSNVIYHPQMDSTLLYGEKIAVDSPDRVIGPNHIRYNFNGVEKEAVWAPLSNGMMLYVTVPVAEINSGWHKLIGRTILASLVVIVAAAIVMLRFTGKLTKPLSDLTEAAKQVDGGNYEFTLEYNKDDEVGILTRTFRQLVSHTKDHISDLNKQAYIDALTSVQNKGAYEDYIKKLQDQMNDPEKRAAFAIGVFDCDRLKSVNDTFGHDKGDMYLKNASGLICRVFSRSAVFRTGGDEFVAVIQGEDFDNMEDLVRRFSDEQKELCAASNDRWDQVSISFGIAVYDPQIDDTAEGLISRADRLMYENKRAKKGSGQ